MAALTPFDLWPLRAFQADVDPMPWDEQEIRKTMKLCSQMRVPTGCMRCRNSVQMITFLNFGVFAERVPPIFAAYHAP